MLLHTVFLRKSPKQSSFKKKKAIINNEKCQFYSWYYTLDLTRKILFLHLQTV